MKHIIDKLKDNLDITDGEIPVIIICLFIIVIFNILFSEPLSREDPEVHNNYQYRYSCFVKSI